MVAIGVLMLMDSHDFVSREVNKVTYQANFFTSKQDIHQVGFIPKWMYTEVPLCFRLS